MSSKHYEKISRCPPPPPVTIFDVGANVGNYIKTIRSILGNNVQIFAFEPSNATYHKMIDNTREIKNLHSYNFGLGNENSLITLYSDAQGSGLASIYKRKLEHFNIKMELEERIEVKTLDSFCRENIIPHIHFLKLDVEGHELKVIEGAKEMIKSNNIDFIQFEFGGCNIDSRTYFQDFFYILKDKYNIYRIVKDGLFEIKAYKELYECFLYSNFFAERITS